MILSKAVHVTVVSPNENESGESLVTEIISTVSLPEPRPISAKFPSAPLASIVMLSGAVMPGAVVSTTVTV